MARKEAGFTLVEVMFSLVILSVITLSSVNLVVYASRSNYATWEREAAFEAARQTLETIQGANFSNIYGQYNNYQFTVDSETGVVSALAGSVTSSSIVGTVQVNQNIPAQVTVTITWTDPSNNQETLQMTTLMVQRS